MKRQQKTAQLEQLSPICGRVKVIKYYWKIRNFVENDKTSFKNGLLKKG